MNRPPRPPRFTTCPSTIWPLTSVRLYVEFNSVVHCTMSLNSSLNIELVFCIFSGVCLSLLNYFLNRFLVPGWGVLVHVVEPTKVTTRKLKTRMD